LFSNYAEPPEQSLVHPALAAERIVMKRRRPSDLVAVRVYRGRPNPEYHRTATAANDAQTAAWERDPRIRVIRRDLNYRGWPEHPPREKGIDVAIAVDLVRTAMLKEYDVAVLFSGDTDLLPALETAFTHTEPNIEVACWVGAKPLWFPNAVAAKRYLPYCHFLSADDFEAARDHTKYV
jgi:NYN domain